MFWELDPSENLIKSCVLSSSNSTCLWPVCPDLRVISEGLCFLFSPPGEVKNPHSGGSKLRNSFVHSVNIYYVLGAAREARESGESQTRDLSLSCPPASKTIVRSRKESIFQGKYSPIYVSVQGREIVSTMELCRAIKWVQWREGQLSWKMKDE